MTPFDLVAGGQNGRMIENMASRFGLSEAQAEDAVRTMLPTLNRAVQTNIQTKSGLESLLRALSSGHHERYYDDPGTFSDTAVASDGRAILGHILGTPRQTRALAKQASYATGIGGALLEQILPYLASVLMGMIFKQGGSSIRRKFDRGPDIQGFPGMPDTGGNARGGGGDSYSPQEYEAPEQFPYEDMADEVSRRSPLPGGFSTTIRDAIGGILGGKASGIAGYIIKFIVLRFGWRIVRSIIGAVLGGRR